MLPQGVKAMLRAGRVCIGRGQGQPFHWRLRAADGPQRAGISASSCDLAEDALVARVSCIGEGLFAAICPLCEP